MSAIEWTDVTWNPARGCSRVSEGCRNCYAERLAVSFKAFRGFAEGTNQGPRWTGRVELIPSKLGEPLRWRKPRRVFVNSMSDLFHEKLSDSDIRQVFDVMAQCPRHTFQVLTKRARRMRHWAKRWRSQSILPNVWLGVSVEDQQTANDRVWDLLFTPAAKRFVSYEPALGAVNFLDAPRSPESTAGPWCYLDDIDWVIVGGESGPGARPFDVAWARSIIDQCRSAETAVFVKQLGANIWDSAIDFHYDGGWPEATRPDWGDPPTDCCRVRVKHPKGGDPRQWPQDLRVREWPE